MDGFGKHCLLSGLCDSTKKKYTDCVQQILSEYSEKELYSQDFQNNYVIDRLAKGISKNSIAIYLKGWRHWLKYKGIEQPRTDFKNLKQPSMTQTFSEDQVLKLNEYLIDKFKTSEGRYIAERRRCAVFWLLVIWTGARCGEIANSRLHQYNQATNTLTIHATKTSSMRSVPIPKLIQEVVYEYLDSAGELPFQGYCAQTWHQSFKKLLKENNIKRSGLKPHSFRHTFISMLLDEDVAMPKVMALVGHKRIETTFGYTHLLSKSGRKAVKSHPVLKKLGDPREKMNDFIKAGFELASSDPNIFLEIEQGEYDCLLKLQIRGSPQKGHPTVLKSQN